MSHAKPLRPLAASEVDLTIDPQQLGFETTEELEPLDCIVGQPRALRALEFGLGVRHPGYNIYVAGASGMGKSEMIRRALANRVEHEPTPPDWVYVNNFDETDRPLAISLPPGQAIQLRNDVDDTLDRLVEELPKAFRREELSQEKEQLQQRYQQRDRELNQQMEQVVSTHEMTIQETPAGIVMIPLKNNRPITQEEVKKLSDDERRQLDERQQAVAQEIRGILARRRDVERELRTRVRQLEYTVASSHIVPLIDSIAERHDSQRLRGWLEQLKAHMINHWERFRQQEEPQQQGAAAMINVASTSLENRFRVYQINVMVDNRDVSGAPVIVEHSPNYKNLFGVIERTADQIGRETTDFTRLKSGSLLRANGGYLVLNLVDALMEPVVWKELKRSIKRGSLQIEAYEPMGLFSTTALKPEPIPLNIKLVVVGDPRLYHVLQLADEDFAEIFKVKAEFDPEMERSKEAGQIVGRLLKKLAVEEDLGAPPFAADAVAELLRVGARLAADKQKLTTSFSCLTDLSREAGYWARSEQAVRVERRHVRQASQERIYRGDLVFSKIREMIECGALKISLDGTMPGQVNGLAVADLGDYAFGRPLRVTASVGVGAAGVINVERESKLSGRTYDKGILILEGYLRGKYASQHPLALAASLAMEQSYGMIDGDSATVAELVALLSALADLPVQQGIAITGSVNQHGEVQAVGGVNEKIEGFFDVCQQAALTGQQGVAIPAANVRNVVLRPDVVSAVADGQFNVWAIDHVDQALELLCQQPAGDLDQEGTVHHAVARRLRALAGILKEQGPGQQRSITTVMPTHGPPADPRPPLPGSEEQAHVAPVSDRRLRVCPKNTSVKETDGG